MPTQDSVASVILNKIDLGLAALPAGQDRCLERPLLALDHRRCTERSTGKVE